MLTMRIIAASLSFLLLGGAAPTQGPEVPDERSCIDVQAIADTPVRDDRTIDFVLRGKGRPTYRNVLQDTCPLLGVERTFTFSAIGNRLCRGNPIQVLQNGRVIPGPTCLLGGFQKVADAR